MNLGRLVYAVAASAAFCAQPLAMPAYAAQPRAVVQGDLDPRLKAAIARAIGDVDRPIQNRFEARRRAREAAADAVAVLRSEGYYANQVEPEVGEGDAPVAMVAVAPGPQFLIMSPAVSWIAPTPDGPAMDAAQQALGLREGQPGRAEDVVAAEGRVISTVQKHGYADAEAAPREVVVDHADHSVRPTYRIRSGALVRLDGLQLVTKGRTRLAWLQGLAPWRSGDPYRPDYVAELERRLLDAGAFESVTVALAPLNKTTPEGLRPVIVSLAERKRRTIELGASYGTNEGLGLNAKFTRYNLFGRADTSSLSGKFSRLDSRVGVDVSLPHWRRPDQTFTAATQAYRVRTDAYDQTGVGAQADVQRHYSKTSYLTLGVLADVSRTNELRIEELTPLGRNLVTLGTLADLALDRSDDPLNPKHGYRVEGRGEPTVILGEGAVPYLKLQASASGYLPFGPQARTVLAGRVHLGSIVNGGIPQIPASQRFYAGGGGSVRGYGYQAVGPQLADGTPRGGLSLLEASAELRHDLSGRWGFAAFVDAGAIGTTRFPTVKDLSIGAGLGVRYNLGFGPIRVDVATPINNRRGRAPYQIYVSIGQSF